MKLLALDVDGTLFGTDGKITKVSIETMKTAREKGIQIVLASGRDYDGLPWEQLQEVDIDYVITTNGSAVYRTCDRKCLAEECLDAGKMIPIFTYILSQEVYLGVFIDGVNYTPAECAGYIERMNLPEYVKSSLRNNGHKRDDLLSYIRNHDARIQKATLNFQCNPDGTYLNREKVRQYLEKCPYIHIVDGGFANLEFTRSGINKSTGLKFLCEYLGIALRDTMAIGDSENDIEMLRDAGLGIAMGNAVDAAKEAADDVTLTNSEDGVAKAIKKYLL